MKEVIADKLAYLKTLSDEQINELVVKYNLNTVTVEEVKHDMLAIRLLGDEGVL